MGRPKERATLEPGSAFWSCFLLGAPPKQVETGAFRVQSNPPAVEPGHQDFLSAHLDPSLISRHLYLTLYSVCQLKPQRS